MHTGHTSGTVGCRIYFHLEIGREAGWLVLETTFPTGLLHGEEHQVWFLPRTLHHTFPSQTARVWQAKCSVSILLHKGPPSAAPPAAEELSHTRWPGAPPCWLPGQAGVHLLLLHSRLLKVREPERVGGLFLVKTKYVQTFLIVCPDQWVLIFRKAAFILFSFPFLGYVITSYCSQERWAIQPYFPTKFGHSLGSTFLHTSPPEHGKTAVSSSSQKYSWHSFCYPGLTWSASVLCRVILGHLFGISVVIAWLIQLLSFWRIGVEMFGYIIYLNSEPKKVIHSSG